MLASRVKRIHRNGSAFKVVVDTPSTIFSLGLTVVYIEMKACSFDIVSPTVDLDYDGSRLKGVGRVVGRVEQARRVGGSLSLTLPCEQ